MNPERFDSLIDALRLFTEGARTAAQNKCRGRYTFAEVLDACEWLGYWNEPSERAKIAEFLTS